MRSLITLSAVLGLVSAISAQMCYNIPNGNIVCAGAANNTFRICDGGVPSTEIQRCASPLVCCGNECVASSDAKCFPPIDPNCRGVQDYQTVCTSRSTFNYCLNQRVYAFSADQSCAAGTVCCPSTGRCVFESQCTIFNQPAPPAVPPTTPSPPAQPPVNPGSCIGVPDFRTTCSSSNTFLYCLKNAPYPNSGPQPCAPGTVCCANSGICDFARNCPASPSRDVPVDPAAPSPSPAPPVQVVAAATSCTGVIDGDIVCSGADTFNVCSKNAIVASRKCATGTVCCTTTNRCDFASRCGPAGVITPPPVTPPAPVTPSPCTGILDGFKVCSADGFSIFACTNGFISATETCLYGSKCCGSTKTCTAPNACPDGCVGKPDGFISCKGEKFDICAGGRSAGTISCGAGTVCCQSKQTCDFIGSCPGLSS